MKNNIDSVNRVYKFPTSSKIITEDLLLKMIQQGSPIQDDLTITFVADTNFADGVKSSAIDITLKNTSKTESIDLSKIKTLKDLKDQGITLEMNRGANKNYQVNYNKEELILGDLIPIQFEPNIAKNLTRPIPPGLSEPESIEYKSDLSNYIYQGNKTGGANSPGKLGGIYTLGNSTFLIKQDTKKGKIRSNKVISEYIANKVFNTMYPGVGPNISLVSSNREKKGEDKKDEYAYLAVEFFKDDYRDLYQDVAKVLGKEVPKSRFEPFSSDISAGIKQASYDNIYSIVAGSLFLGDFSIHSGNIGVTGLKNTVRIDFGSAFTNMIGKVEYDKKISNRFYGNKNYFQRDYDDEVKLHPDFVKALRNIPQKEAAKAFNETVEECANVFSQKALTKFALDSKWITKEEAARLTDGKELVARIKENGQKIFNERKQSLNNYASNIELELLLRESKQNNKPIDQEKLKEVLDNNKDHFVNVAMGLDKIKPVNSNNKITPQIKDQIKELLQTEIKEKKLKISNDIKEAADNYFKNTANHGLNVKDLSKEISGVMRDKGLATNKVSDSKLNRICNITSEQILAAHNKKIGFWEKCGIIIDKFIDKLCGSKNTKKLLNETVRDVKIDIKDKEILNDIASTLRRHSSPSDERNAASINSKNNKNKGISI